MFQSFTYMFEKENFKKHFLLLFWCTILFSILSFFMFFLFLAFKDVLLIFIPSVVSFSFFFICASLLAIGYFWDLTEIIIDRKTEYISSQIYDGRKPKKKYIFELPKFKIFKHVWRGFAASFATFLAILPYLALITFSAITGSLCQVPMQILIFSVCLYWFLFPALFWDYARLNSVVAVLNIPKAVNIIGNYPLQYISRFCIFIVLYAVNLVIDEMVASFIKSNYESGFNFLSVSFLLIILLVILAKNIYFFYVYAYLLGTLMPSEEA